MNLADMQNLPEAGVAGLSHEEERRIMAFPIPGELPRKYGGGATYYPRRPIENPGRWFADHRERLRNLEMAEGIR